MSADIESVVLETIHISKNFFLQLDESVEISWPAQLIANVCFVMGISPKKTACLARHDQKKQKGSKFFGSHPRILKKEN